MFSIGEFSKITGLTIKTLRFYHEKGVLTPSRIDPDTGYRFYAAAKVDHARIISELRDLEFSLTEIAEIVAEVDDDADILEHLARRKIEIERDLQRYRDIGRRLDQIINTQREARAAMNTATFEIERKTLEPMLIASVRMRGRYSDCGRGFAQIGRRFGRAICGKPLLLHYDNEYKEEDADFEACMPISRGESRDGIDVRELAGGECVSLHHRGPYDQLGRSYENVFAYLGNHRLESELPTREVYHKGPGMIFKGNPANYLTEIQVLIRGV